MFRSLVAPARAGALPGLRAVVRWRVVAASLAGVSLLAAAAVVLLGRSPAVAPVTCDRRATQSSFASEVSAASAGKTICLASGDYGIWRGTNKAITITAAPGASPQMTINFGSGDSGFTLDGMTGMGGTISAGAKNITISHSTFVSTIDIEGSISDVVLDRDHFDWNAVSSPRGANAKIFVDVHGTLSAPALMISNSTILNGDLDGVHIGGGSGVQVVGNEFGNLCDRGVNHTDNIQFESGTQIRIADNYVHEAQSCPTQGITSYDGGTYGLVIEDNVVDVPRDWGIELYSDQNSIVRHNTVVWHPKSYSESSTGTGRIDIDRKSQDPAGTGTHVYDNIATSVDFNNGSTGIADHNVSGQEAKYVGPLTSWAGFKLSPGSPVGRKAASDGLDDGARNLTGPKRTPPAGTAQRPRRNAGGTAVTLDRTGSKGAALLLCTRSFENQKKSTICETQPAGRSRTTHAMFF